MFLANETYQLPNGLTVILHEDHRAPLVAVHIRYHVGAYHEQGGLSGLAHLFEHLLFHGSDHISGSVFGVLSSIGARNANASTSLDHTDLYELVPPANLETALWMESDRMGFPSLDGIDLDAERSIVRSERRQRVEIGPYVEARTKQWQALFPSPHPYHQLVIGSHSDLALIKPPDVRNFFSRWYSPSNATLVIAGDFQTARTKGWIEKYFSTLPSVPRPQPPAVAAIRREQATTLVHREDLGTAPLVSLAWLIPPPAKDSQDDAVADILQLLLSRGSGGRLRQRLMGRFAASCTALHRSLRAQSVFSVEAQASDPAVLPQIVEEVDAVLRDLAEQGVTEGELKHAQAWYRSATFLELESLQGKAEQLVSYYGSHGKANFLAMDLIRHQVVTSQQVQELIKRFLGKEQRVLVYAVPKNLPLPTLPGVSQ